MSIGAEIAEIYHKHKDIASYKQELADKAAKVLLSPRSQRSARAADEREARTGKPLSKNQKNILVLGHRLGTKVIQVAKDYWANDELSSAHYASHASEYHHLALDDMHANNIATDFDGSVALRVVRHAETEQPLEEVLGQ
jgi:hypothetical protein